MTNSLGSIGENAFCEHYATTIVAEVLRHCGIKILFNQTRDITDFLELDDELFNKTLSIATRTLHDLYGVVIVQANDIDLYDCYLHVETPLNQSELATEKLQTMLVLILTYVLNSGGNGGDFFQYMKLYASTKNVILDENFNERITTTFINQYFFVQPKDIVSEKERVIFVWSLGVVFEFTLSNILEVFGELLSFCSPAFATNQSQAILNLIQEDFES